MDSVIETLVAKAEAICYQLAPLDLVKTKLYIVRQSRIPPELGGNSICDGFTAPRLDLYLKDVIGPAWQGRGPCLVVNDTDYPETMDALDVETDFFSTVLHELGHILERSPLAEPGPKLDADYLQFEAFCMGRLLARELTAEEEDDAFEGHGQNFLRIVLHLQQRAQERGVWLTPFRLCGYRIYNLSHANCYRRALGDEPQRLAEASFREILAVPPPPPFSQLWTEDLVRRSKPISPKEEL